jgi:ABC-type bacteriocin/lantibiotic exporter with double-glycine peptidase domain
LVTTSTESIYSNLTETLNGLTTIRNLGIQNFFLKKNNKHLDNNMALILTNLITNEFENIRIVVLFNLFYLVLIFFLLINKYSANTMGLFIILFDIFLGVLFYYNN